MDQGIMALPTTGMPRTTPFPSTSPSPRKIMSKRRTLKKGRDIGNDIFCKLCKCFNIGLRQQLSRATLK
jgi:hypothetical protein